MVNFSLPPLQGFQFTPLLGEPLPWRGQLGYTDATLTIYTQGPASVYIPQACTLSLFLSTRLLLYYSELPILENVCVSMYSNRTELVYCETSCVICYL